MKGGGEGDWCDPCDKGLGLSGDPSCRDKDLLFHTAGWKGFLERARSFSNNDCESEADSAGRLMGFGKSSRTATKLEGNEPMYRLSLCSRPIHHWPSPRFRHSISSPSINPRSVFFSPPQEYKARHRKGSFVGTLDCDIMASIHHSQCFRNRALSLSTAHEPCDLGSQPRAGNEVTARPGLSEPPVISASGEVCAVQMRARASRNLMSRHWSSPTASKNVVEPMAEVWGPQVAQGN